MAERQKDIVPLPLEVRVRMTHALIAVTCRENGIDVLHIKGHSAPDGFYRPNRTSSDADILVRPSQARLLVSLLTANGWETVTTFESGSIFQHAAALWHETWGYVDLHRSFPGIEMQPEKAFANLWAARETKTIAHRLCNVPGRIDHGLLITIHAARDPSRGSADVDFLKSTLRDEWTKVESRARELSAIVPFVVASGSASALETVSELPALPLWQALSKGSSRTDLFRARLRSAQSSREKLKIVLSATKVNRDHLEMRLQRAPTIRDIALEWISRSSDAISNIIAALRKGRKS